MDDMKRDFRVTFPPIEPDPGEPPPRSGQRCVNCNAFTIIPHPIFGQQMVCAANPPTAVFVGMQQTMTINPKTGQKDQYPFIMGLQPPTEPEKWCRSWEWVGPGDGSK
jgi:hypothetical protein